MTVMARLDVQQNYRLLLGNSGRAREDRKTVQVATIASAMQHIELVENISAKNTQASIY